MLKYLAMTLIASAMLVDSGLAQTPQDDVSNDVEIIEPPRPLYPFLAEVLGIEGMCEVRFNLLAGGVLVEIEEIACTHPVFCSAARDSVRQAKFRVIDLPGSKHPGQRNNLVYPMEFKFDDSERTWSGGAPCTSDLVS